MPGKTGLFRLHYGLFATPLEDMIARKLECIEHRIDEYLDELGMYKQRQAIVGHPFGMIKRSGGFNHMFFKSKEKGSGVMAIIFTAYMAAVAFNSYRSSLISKYEQATFARQGRMPAQPSIPGGVAIW